VRPECVECVIKHLSTAYGYMVEAFSEEYEHHAAYAWGELVHAEQEILAHEPDGQALYSMLRQHRKEYEKDLAYDYPIDSMIRHFWELRKDMLKEQEDEDGEDLDGAADVGEVSAELGEAVSEV